MKTKILKTLTVTLLVVSSLLGSGYTTASPHMVEAVNNVNPGPASVNISTCQMFPANNFWNVPVNALPVDARSSAWVNTIGASTGFHMDFGAGTWDGGPIGIPYNIVASSSVSSYPFTFYYPDDSDPGPYPLPASPAIEWGSDHHILTVDTDTCKLYEIYDASKTGGQWQGGSGAIWDLNSNALRTDTWTSADAAGLPILPGLVRYDEVVAGVIEHALRFTASCTANNYIWPARHKAQYGTCATPVPFGARFRLKSGFNISGYSHDARVILQAFKTYGIVLADNGSDWYVSGEPNSGWNDDVLHEIDNVVGSNFEAVDTSGLMTADPNSGATNYFETHYQTNFPSQGANDGWVLESSETSNLGGAKNNTAITFNLGDDAARKQYRAVLSFSTGVSLPDTAIITRTTLKLKKSGVAGGGNPVAIFQGFMVDIKKGTFGTSALALGDFKSTASKAYGPFVTAISAGWYNINLASSNSYVNKTGSGLTQIRLRFKSDDNNNSVANFLKLYSGNAGAANRPQLVIEYYIP